VSISIYYEASRKYPLSADEQARIDAIVERCDADKTFDDGEDFQVYDYDPDEPEAVFQGATGLPWSDDPMRVVEACVYWAKCLTEIRLALPDAEWKVNMDDTDLEWDGGNGWHLPGMEWNEEQGWHLPM
jgi:hypothetical protein